MLDLHLFADDSNLFFSYKKMNLNSSILFHFIFRKEKSKLLLNFI